MSCHPNFQKEILMKLYCPPSKPFLMNMNPATNSPSNEVRKLGVDEIFSHKISTKRRYLLCSTPSPTSEPLDKISK
jgi:hypothetical protein